MSFSDDQISKQRPGSIADIDLPNNKIIDQSLVKIGDYTPSPISWQDEILYFLLVDRFSNGDEKPENLLNRENLSESRPLLNGRETWWWEDWCRSGSERFQGGTINGIKTKLDYLRELGITTIWISPIFKQRCHLNTYHGYGIQDFLDVDPRFGTRSDLVELVKCAHEKGIWIILDIIFNHSGYNFDYPEDTPGGKEKPAYNKKGYKFGNWLDEKGLPIENPDSYVFKENDAVWPCQLRNESLYSLKGKANLTENDYLNPEAEHKRGDFENLRDFNLDAVVDNGKGNCISFLADCFKYWIALTDCDGFRIDTVKHVSKENARNFCGAIKEYATRLGKTNFLMLGEVAGGDDIQNAYLNAVPRNLSAVLDIGNNRININNVVKGFTSAENYFNSYKLQGISIDTMPSHRTIGDRHVIIVDDHDHVTGTKLRIGESATDAQILCAIALQFFCLGIPCIYYGTEQALKSGPLLDDEKRYLIERGGSDRYLREAMFGPLHPLAEGIEGYNMKKDNWPGFGPFGTAGKHCFDSNFKLYQDIAKLAKIRKEYPALRHGRQYLRPISIDGSDFHHPLHGGEIVAWSRIIDNQEILCVFNSNGAYSKSAKILADKTYIPKSKFSILFNSLITNVNSFEINTYNGIDCIDIHTLPPSSLIVLIGE